MLPSAAPSQAARPQNPRAQVVGCEAPPRDRGAKEQTRGSGEVPSVCALGSFWICERAAGGGRGKEGRAAA